MCKLDEIIYLLNKHQQRATYGAVAGVLGRSARGLMKGRDHCTRDSWVVATRTNSRSGARRGWPTTYKDHEIHPECMKQINENVANFIHETKELEKKLKDWRKLSAKSR